MNPTIKGVGIYKTDCKQNDDMEVNTMQDACKKLWSAVLEQAIRDAQGNYDSEEARKWFLSEDDGTASLIWICDLLGLEPDLFRKAYRYEWSVRDYCKVVITDQRSGL